MARKSMLTWSWNSGDLNAWSTLSFSIVRILFGGIFLFDGILKWSLFASGQMQGVIDGFGIGYLSSNWVLFGALVGLGETIGGACLLLGIFPRIAAAWSAVIMGSIWVYGGYGGWGQPGYTDPGGDLMLALIFATLVLAPYSYGVASHWKIRERLAGGGIWRRFFRSVLT